MNFDIYGADAEFGGGDYYVSNAADFQKLQDTLANTVDSYMKSDYHQNQNAMKDKSKIGKHDKKLGRDYTQEDWDLEHGKKGKYNPASYYNCPPGQTYNTVDQKCE